MVSEIHRTPPSKALQTSASSIAEHVGFELEQVSLDLGQGGLEQLAPSDADAIVRALGYEPEGGTWRELGAVQARELIIYNVGHDLAYRNPSVRSRTESEALAEELLALIGAPTRCFTRHSKLTAEQGSHGLAPTRRDWTFSEPYLFVGETLATLCTFLAED
jgi:hypothetical protein